MFDDERAMNKYYLPKFKEIMHKETYARKYNLR